MTRLCTLKKNSQYQFWMKLEALQNANFYMFEKRRKLLILLPMFIADNKLKMKNEIKCFQQNILL